MPDIGITNYSNLNAANTTYLTKFSEIFAGGPKGTSQLIAEKLSTNSKITQLDIMASFPRIREWLGSKVYKPQRVYKQDITLKRYEASIRRTRFDVEYDPTGLVAKSIGDFVSQQAYCYDDIAWTVLVANPTCYDGVSLLNDTHVNVHSSGTSDNLTTSSLTYETFRAGIQAMERVTDEDGKPLGIYPTDLFVGPAQRRKALEVAGASRPITTSVNAFDPTTGIVAVTAIANGLAGEVNVHIVPWLSGNQWFLMDLSKPGAKPLVCVEGRGPTAIPMVDMDGPVRFETDEMRWSIEADVTFAAGAWQLIYGSVST